MKTIDNKLYIGDFKLEDFKLIDYEYEPFDQKIPVAL